MEETQTPKQNDQENRFLNFLSDYEEYVQKVLKPEHGHIKSFIEHWQEPYFWSQYAKSSQGICPSPLRAIFTRIKRPEKVVDKILQKSWEYPWGLSRESFMHMHDCIGVRIVVYFLSQLTYVDRELRTSNSFEISKEIPPKAYMNPELMNRFGLSHIGHTEKESGYASLHYIVRLNRKRGRSEDDFPQPWFEIQVRTLAQELWSEMEHILAYKSEKWSNFSSRSRFSILSREICAIDEHFNLLYEELLQSQEISRHAEEEELNSENLAYALSQIGIRCAQQDFTTILSLLHSRGVKTLKDFAGLATPKRLETIRNTYINHTGRSPDSFELIACLGSLQGMTSANNESLQVVSHIEFSKSWNKLRKEILRNRDSKENPRFFKI